MTFKLSPRNRQLILLIVQLLIIILCVTVIETIYNKNILPDKKVKQSFVQTNCLLISKELAKKKCLITRYRSDFIVRYTANGETFQNKVSGNGLDNSYTLDRTTQENNLNKLVVGDYYPCWFNAEAPNTVVLIQRERWTGIYPIFIPAVLLIVATYYFLRTFFRFFGFGRIRKSSND